MNIDDIAQSARCSPSQHTTDGRARKYSVSLSGSNAVQENADSALAVHLHTDMLFIHECVFGMRAYGMAVATKQNRTESPLASLYPASSFSSRIQEISLRHGHVRACNRACG